MEPGDSVQLELGVMELDDGRTVLVDPTDFQPKLVELRIRPSKASPTRFKAVLGIPLIEGESLVAPLPFASTGAGYTPEFRLEMN
jgi:hypothetical protein